MSKKEKAIGVAAILCVLGLIISVHQVGAIPKFVIAAWGDLDEYGQGINSFKIYENSTGSWVQVNGLISHDDPCIFNWSAGAAIKLYCYTWFNSTLTGAGSSAEGKNLQRHNVTVTNQADVVVFSKQNFTYYSVDTGIDPPRWLYEYYVVLNFIPAFGEYYTVTVIYEILW